MDEIYQLLIVATQAELNALKPQWQHIFSQIKEAGYYLDWHWHNLMNHYLLDNAIRFYCLYNGESLIAVFPLVLQSSSLGPLRWNSLQTPNHSHATLYDALIHPAYLDRDLLSVLIKQVTQDPDNPVHFFRFTKVRRRSNLFSLIEKHQFSSKTYISISEGCGYIPCTSEADLKQLSKSYLRNTVRHQRNAAKQLGPVNCNSIIGSSISDQDIDDFLTIEASGWKGETGAKTAIMLDLQLKNFYRTLIKELSASEDVCINFLEINQQRCAAQLALKCRHTWYLLKICYSPFAQSFGPSNILMRWFIEESAKNSAIEEINLTTAPEWSKRMHIQYENVHTITFFSNSIIGKIFNLAAQLRKKFFN